MIRAIVRANFYIDDDKVDKQEDLVKLFEEAVNNKILPRYKGYKGSEWGFDISELPEMQTDMVNMAKWINEVPLTANERRDVFNYEEIDNELMDEVYIPSGLVNINDVTVNQL